MIRDLDTDLPAPTAGERCPACGSGMVPDQHPWLFRCIVCGCATSTLPVSIGSQETSVVDESARSAALAPLRAENFESILDVVEAIGAPPGRWLDVGCAHGWFIDAASSRGHDIMGIEPDADVAALGRSRGLNIVHGYFPLDLDAGKGFSLIIFNDVLEHIPNPADVVARAAELLHDDGLLVVNIPLSTGVLYRAARQLDRLGASGPLERMWQRDFPSPHLLYCRPENVRALMTRGGLDVIYSGDLRSVSRRGLWSRIRYDDGAGVIASVVPYVGLSVMAPLLTLMPSDIGLFVARKTSPPR